MEINENKKESPNQLFSPSNIIALYTVLSTLLKMRRELGLEAMLEYMENYLHILENNNPQMQWVVAKALELIDVRKIYNEAFKE